MKTLTHPCGALYASVVIYILRLIYEIQPEIFIHDFYDSGTNGFLQFLL